MSIPTRRSFLAAVAAACGVPQLSNVAVASPIADFEFKYIVASCMYGYMYLGEILPEVAHCGVCSLDIVPKSHGNHLD